MAGNVIFRGPVDRQPTTITKPVTGALLPGQIVEETATALVSLGTAIAKRPLVLMNNDYLSQDIVTAYTTGSTGQAYEPSVNDTFNARLAAGTYTFMQPLTVVAGGLLGATTVGSIVVAWFIDIPGNKLANSLNDVKWANSYVSA